MKLGQVVGIDVFLHWTFIFAPLGLILQSWYLQNSIAMTSVLLVLLICVFACVLLHEFGHALAARMFGVDTKDIILTPIGGLARMVSMPRKPFHEFVITLAGPLVNLGLVGVSSVILVLMEKSFYLPKEIGVGDLPIFLFYINLFLFAFNLIPAFPMDGGRILRASLATFLGFSRATLVAGAIGQVLAVAFGVYGLLTLQYPLMIIGVFVFLMATTEISASREEHKATHIG